LTDDGEADNCHPSHIGNQPPSIKSASYFIIEGCFYADMPRDYDMIE
jgi:hypothetical protein